MLKGLTDAKILKHLQYISQAPQPIVRIVSFDPKTNKEDTKNTIVLRPSDTDKEKNILQSYSFKFSTSDTDGSFSLTLYPGNVGIEEIPIFDMIKPLQIVYIYERDKEAKIPDFVGVINRKKFVAQAGSGLRISVTGKSVASFISRFKISLDLNAMSLTNQMIEQTAINTELTTALAKENPLLVSTVIKKIWEKTVELAKKAFKLSNFGLEKYISEYLGSDFLDVEKGLKIKYPLASVFNGQSTINFWDIVGNIIPYPVYEKYAYINEKGETKLKIREVPFDCSADGYFSTLDNLEKDMTELDPAIIKSFDLEISDDEVYTAFFSHIVGSPIDIDKALRLAAQTDGYGANEVSLYATKADIYGYSLLTISFNGYGKNEKDYKDGGEKLTDFNKRLELWYGHLDEMFKGTITLSTIVREQMPMCGEIVSFLGGEFYVNETEHSWSFGGNPETKLTVSRGGDYSTKKFAPLKNITKRYSIFKKLLETKALFDLNGIKLM